MGIFGSEITENLIRELRESGDHKEADRILIEHHSSSLGYGVEGQVMCPPRLPLSGEEREKMLKDLKIFYSALAKNLGLK